MKTIRWIIALLALSMLGSGCRKQVPDENGQLDEATRQERKYVNTFAWNVMDTYYLWRDEIAPALKKWQTWEEPIQKVADIRPSRKWRTSGTRMPPGRTSTAGPC